MLIAGAVIFYLKFMPGPAVPHVHYHAGFHLYVDGVKQDFTDFKYMSFIPCNEHDSQKLTPEEEQLEKAHLHDQVGDVVHVHRDGATWNDLLINLGFGYDYSKEVRGYSAQGEMTDILSQPIKANDSIVILIGDQTKASELVKNRVTLDAIQKVESTSELCGS